VFAVPAGADHDRLVGRGVDEQTARIAAEIDPGFLAEVGWDRRTGVLFPPADHPLLGRPVCRAPNCTTTAPDRTRICQACRRRLTDAGLSEEEVMSLPPRGQWRAGRGPQECVVDGCARTWVSSRKGLCHTHLDLQASLGMTLSAFLAHPLGRPVAACEACSVAACTRQRRHRDGDYCEAHQIRLRTARRKDPGLDERRWRAVEPAIGRGGEVSLRGLPDRVVAEVLFGLQQRCRSDATKTGEAVLRAVGDDLRRRQVACLGDYIVPDDRDLEFKGLARCLVGHARRALATPQTEVAKDEWDLVLFGHHGTVSFTDITQDWLRQIAKRWAADDLPRRRVRPGRRTSAGLSVRHHVGALARLSQSLRMRPDRGEHPAGLGRADMEVFLHRLAYLESGGRISRDARTRAVREVRAVLTRARAMGLTRPGGPAAGLSEDFTLSRTDVPAEPEPGEPHRDLPAEIMRQICAHLDKLICPQMRTGIELAIDTGRRPEEICDLDHDCLTRDGDGLAVLVYDNHKADRPGRRLPISEHTATLITTQQQRVRARFPRTPVGELKLLPTDRRNPDGARAITAFSLAFHHRTWIQRLPVLHTDDGTEFDKAKVVLYAYRHTYAQRHADAGVPVDVLRELMSHRKLDTTNGYYRVGEERRREAVDRVAAMQFDRHGNRLWPQVQALLDAAHPCPGLHEAAVPFGVCAEPSNVTAGGRSCPFRFRCAGCDHFRTDISHLPDLQAYLDDLLRARERLLAASPTALDPWARAEATPSDEEIGRIRALINRLHTGLAELTPDERRHVDDAVAVVRRHRSLTLGMPRIRQTAPDPTRLDPERNA
jgi:integrase